MTNVSQNATTGNQIQVFSFTQNEVRTAKDENGEPLFCLSDVANVLEIDRTSNLLQVEKGVVNDNTPRKRGTLNPKGVHKMYILTNGGNQEITFIDERNLYRVIFRSNKPEAVKFQDWIYDEVIPTIRKTGGYTTKPITSLNALIKLCDWADKKFNSEAINFKFFVETRFNVENLTELSEAQIEQATEYVLGFVDKYDMEDSHQNAYNLPQLNHPVSGNMIRTNLRSALSAVIQEVASRYVDESQANMSIFHHLEQECRVAHLSYLTKDRLSIALRTLAKLNDEGIEHERQITLLDQSALRSISGNGMQLCYMQQAV